MIKSNVVAWAISGIRMPVTDADKRTNVKNLFKCSIEFDLTGQG
jgi:hypothetical protein